MCIMCVLPGVVAIKIQFNVCYLVLFVCLLAKQANIQTTPGNVVCMFACEASKHTNNTR